MTNEPRQTGREAVVKIPNGSEVPVSNVTWDIETQSTDVQHNDSLKATSATTGLRVSGSFEYDGANEELRSKLWYTTSDDAVKNGYKEAGEPKRFTMTVKEKASEEGADGLPRLWTFTGVSIQNMTRDIPADDVTSSSFDWRADDWDVSETSQ